jgi:hypothetical protein
MAWTGVAIAVALALVGSIELRHPVIAATSMIAASATTALRNVRDAT